MKIKISRKLTQIYIVCASLLLLVLAACNDQQQPTSSDSGSEAGFMRSTLTAPDNRAFTLLKCEKSDSNVFLHFHIHNGGNNELDILGKGSIYQIKAEVKQLTILATLPTSDESHLYPALPTRIAPGRTVDGWVSIENASVNCASPTTIEYVFDQVATQACIVPSNPNTCRPAYLDKSLLWYLQNK